MRVPRSGLSGPSWLAVFLGFSPNGDFDQHRGRIRGQRHAYTKLRTDD
jgi:hypothetical protein